MSVIELEQAQFSDPIRIDGTSGHRRFMNAEDCASLVWDSNLQCVGVEVDGEITLVPACRVLRMSVQEKRPEAAKPVQAAAEAPAPKALTQAPKRGRGRPPKVS